MLTLVSAAGSPPAGANCDGCVLVWADEFDGDSVDPDKWELMTGTGAAYGIPGWGNNELQFYTGANAEVVDGVLNITAREQFMGGMNYTSARLRSLGRGDWRYGRFEARVKLPVGQGLWPAFWMLPTDNVYGVWAASGEIDIMESLGHEPRHIHGTLHFGGTSPHNASAGSSYWLPAGTADQFHTYAVEWEEGEIRWYVDDVHYATRTGWWSAGGPWPAPFDQSFHLLLNLAVGGNWPGPPDATTSFPQTFAIDYVRVYQRPDDALPPRRIFDNMDHGNPFGNGWFVFGSPAGGSELSGNFTDLPAQDGGTASLQTGWGAGGQTGYLGGFGRTQPIDLTGMTSFRFWINPDPDQAYTLAINLQDDDNNDGQIDAADDEFEYACEISPTGPCATAGGGWQLVTVPLDSFFDDNSVFPGGNGILDAESGGNGQLINVVVALFSATGADVSFRTDYWRFEGEVADFDLDGVPDAIDNCLEIANAAQIDTDGDAIGNACDMDIAGPGGADDCVVNFADLGVVKAAFFSAEGMPAYNANADFSGPDGVPDGAVNFSDLGRLKSFFFGPPGPSALVNECS